MATLIALRNERFDMRDGAGGCDAAAGANVEAGGGGEADR